MDKTNSQPSNLLETLAPELISRVALHLVNTSFSCGPPSEILPLALTSRTIARALSLSSNSPLLSEVFCLKFDYAAIFRRLGKSNLTTVHLATELRNRCRMLKRLRAGYIDSGTLLDDLWSAFLMMLENDGFNERHLLDWAKLPVFLLSFFRTTKARGRLFEMPQELSLSVWLLWMTSNDDSMRTESPGDRETLVSILQLLVVDGRCHRSFFAPETLFCFGMESQSHTSERSHIVYFGHTLTMHTPPATPAAFLALAVRLDFDQRNKSNSHEYLPPFPLTREIANTLGVGGPTMDDMAELAFSTLVKPWARFEEISGCIGSLIHTTTSERHDTDWRRITLFHDCNQLDSRTGPFKNHTFVPGQLSGLWAGKLMVPDLQAYRFLLASAPGTQTKLIAMYQRPLYMRLREHHCFITDFPVSYGSNSGEVNDFLDAWLPKNYSCIENQDQANLNIYDPLTRRNIKYETFVPDLDGIEKSFYPSMDARKLRRIESLTRIYGAEMDKDAQLANGINDIIVTGETDPRHGDAWGHYTITGRVRPLDGLVVLRRKPRNPEDAVLGTWIFRGYILSSGTLVGRWRECSTAIETPTLEGPFVMTKQ